MAVSTRWTVMAALAAGIVAIAGLAGDAQSASPASRPNVVVLMTDDQTVESMRVMPNVRTLLANEGVTFDNSFVSYSLCCPSRATFLTGQYAHNHGVWGNAAPNGGYYKLDSTNTLPVWLQRAGYQTIHLGKYLNGYGTRSKTEIPPGWGEWYGTPDPSTYRYLGYEFNENGKLVTYPNTAANYKTDIEAQKAVDIIARQALDPRPFFLWVAFLAPHSGGPRDPDDPSGQATPSPAPRHRNLFSTQPLPIPPSFNELDVSDKPAGIRNRPLMSAAKIAAVRENYQQRLESLLAVDEAVGQIVNRLAAIGELDKTYIIFTSDNGFFHGEHRVPNGKVLVYEPSIRVPLIMRGPNIPAGQHRSQFVANIDLAPTIVGANRCTARPDHGRPSLLPFARDPLLYSGRDLLLETPTYAAIRSPNWLYTQYASGRPGAVRPRARSRRAHEPARRPAPCPDAGRPRAPPCPPALVRRPGLPPGPGARPSGAVPARPELPALASPRRRRRPFAPAHLEHGLLPRWAPAQARPAVPRSPPSSRSGWPAGAAHSCEALVTLNDSRRLTLPRRIAGCR